MKKKEKKEKKQKAKKKSQVRSTHAKPTLGRVKGHFPHIQLNGWAPSYFPGGISLGQFSLSLLLTTFFASQEGLIGGDSTNHVGPKFVPVGPSHIWV